MALLISLAALMVATAALALSIWALKASRDAHFNASVVGDAELRRSFAAAIRTDSDTPIHFTDVHLDHLNAGLANIVDTATAAEIHALSQLGEQSPAPRSSAAQSKRERPARSGRKNPKAGE